MLFKRRHPEVIWQKIRVAVWPRRNWLRSYRYVTKRVLRLRATPHAVSFGIAIGVFTSVTPFLGLHILLSMALAFIVRVNVLAAALGTFFGNPLTFPFIWIGTYKLGNMILYGNGGHLGMGQLAKRIIHLSYHELLQIIKPMIVGAIPVGLLAAAVSYFLVRRLVNIYQHSKLAKRVAAAQAKAADNSERSEVE